jgi:hypothetical protein
MLCTDFHIAVIECSLKTDITVFSQTIKALSAKKVMNYKVKTESCCVFIIVTVIDYSGVSETKPVLHKVD